MTDYFAVLLFERRVAGHLCGYTEEIHLLSAGSDAEAQALAAVRGRAQEGGASLNAAGQAVTYQLLRVVDVKPYLFGTPDEAIYTRSFDDLYAYREVATLPGLVPGSLLPCSDLDALAQAVADVFGPPLRVCAGAGGLSVAWAGQPPRRVVLTPLEPVSLARFACNEALEVALEGAQAEASGPVQLFGWPLDTWLYSHCEVSAAPHGWEIVRVSAQGEVLGRGMWRRAADAL